MPTVSTPRSATRSITSRSSGGSNCDLDGQPAGFLHRGGALGDVQRAAVGRPRAAGGERHVDGAVEITRRNRDLGQLAGVFFGDGAPRLEGHTDAAERALVAVAPVGAGLEHGAGQRVEVQQGDLPVGDAVGGGRGRRTAAGTGLGPGDAADRPRRSPSLSSPSRRSSNGERGDARRVGVEGHRVVVDPQHADVRRARRRRPRPSVRTSARSPAACSRSDQIGGV